MTVIGMDVETQQFSKKDNITPQNAKLEGISIAYDENTAEYITDPSRWPLLSPDPDTTVIFHKAVFDIPKLKSVGITVPFEKVEDTKLASWLIDENRNTSLKPLAKELLGVEAVDYKDTDRENEEEFAKYAKNDSLWTRRLWLEKFQHQIKEQGLEQVYQLEKDVLPVALSMEEKGILVDQERLKDLGELVAKKLKAAEAKVDTLLLEYRLTGIQIPPDFNLNSTQQMAKFLYSKEGLGLKCPKLTKKKAPSTDAESLNKLNHPFTIALLEQREYQKLSTAFTEKLPLHIEADGRIHPTFNQMGAVTGRWSCANPNLQQIPSQSEIGKELRKCFIAPPGRKLVVADYSQIELRVLAYFSQDPALIEAFRSGEDLHVKTAARMLGKKIEDVTKHERFIAKMINFGICYGLTPQGLYNRLCAEGIETTEAECEEFVNLYFQTYPGVVRFQKRTRTLCQIRGYVSTLFGRRRRLSGRFQREIRQAGNFVIQGTSADLCKQAMVDIHRALPNQAFIIACIHDEIVVECDDADAEDVKMIVERAMKKVPHNFRVPIEVEVNIAQNWADAK